MTTLANRAAARTALVAALLLVTAAAESPTGVVTQVASAAPATGTLLKTVTIPSSAACGQGSSLGLVAGRMLGQQFAAFPILLATSCNGSSTIFFLDPNSAAGPSTTAALVTTITTTAAPSSGWRALSARPDKSDLLGCGNTGSGDVAVYSIQVGIPNGQVTTPIGTATQLFTAPAAGGSFCDGLAWDSSDKSIFEGPHASSVISHFSQTGVPLQPPTVNSPCPVTNGTSSTSGLAVGGASLFVACGADTKVFQIDKTGANRFSFPPLNVGKNIEGLECDPASFAASGSAALWARDVSLNQLFAFALPRFQCGFVGGASAPFGAQCPASWSGGVGDTTNAAGDGLLDCWKVRGIDINGDGTIDFTLPGASTGHKDVYLEIDSYSNGCPSGPTTPTCAPSPTTIQALVDAFNNAPVSNPDGTTGIHLHVVVDQTLPSSVTGPLAFEPCTLPAAAGSQDFDALKAQFFGTAAERSGPNAANVLAAKAFVFHYVLSVDTLQGLGSTSGCAELPGNDFVAALGHLWSFSSSADVVPSWAGTIMHELGHNLGLRHGGGANIDCSSTANPCPLGNQLSANCKPNYLSVMNYPNQMPNRPVPLASWKLDYSRIALPTLNEGTLDESVGVFGTPANQPLLANGTNPFFTVFGLPTKNGGIQLLVPNASLPINWNGDRVAPPYQVVSGNVNNQGAVTGCDGTGVTLAGFNDWANLQYDFHTSLDFADGVHTTVTASQEITQEQSNAIVTNAAPVLTIDMPAPIAMGTTLVYTITVTNRGPKDGTNVTIVDGLPSGTTFVSSSPDACSVASGLVTCNMGTISVGGSKAETLVLAPTQTPVTNLVAVSSDPDTTIFQTGAAQSSPPVTGTYNWSGFFSPTQNPPAINQANAGSQIPLKFSLGGNFGTNVFASGFPQQQRIGCVAPFNPIGNPTTIPTAGFTLNFNVGTKQYNFNWKSDPAWSGTCRLISLKLNDGTAPHLAYFQF
jgi:uncharacterized repeat protein (TIGR01451 family)